MNEKNKFPIKWRKVANNSLSILGLVFFLFFVFKISQKSYHLEYYGRETNAKIDSVYENWRYQKKITYTFKVNDRLYSSRTWYDEKIKPKVGDSFRVRYSSKNPDINKIFLR